MYLKRGIISFFIIGSFLFFIQSFADEAKSTFSEERIQKITIENECTPSQVKKEIRQLYNENFLEFRDTVLIPIEKNTTLSFREKSIWGIKEYDKYQKYPEKICEKIKEFCGSLINVHDYQLLKTDCTTQGGFLVEVYKQALQKAIQNNYHQIVFSSFVQSKRNQMFEILENFIIVKLQKVKTVLAYISDKITDLIPFIN